MTYKENRCPEREWRSRVERVGRLAIRAAFGVLTTIAPGLAGHLFARLFFTPARRRTSPAGQGWLDRGESFTVRLGEKRIRCWRWGEGPAVLLVHGWNGRAAQLHRFIGPLVEAEHSVVALDGPAHGESDGSQTNGFEFSEAVRAVLASPQGSDVTGVLAHSLGAFAAVNALSREGRDARVVLIAPALRVRKLLGCAFASHGVPERLYTRTLAEIEARFGYDFDRDDAECLLPGMNSSVLITHDHRDGVIPFDDSRVIADALPHVRLLATEGLGHKRALRDLGTVEVALEHLCDKKHDAGAKGASGAVLAAAADYRVTGTPPP